MSNKIKTKVKKKDLLLTREDIKKNINDPKINNLDRMLNLPLYIYRVKAMLYEGKQISARGFLFNDDIYSLPIGKKNAKGEILIDSKIMEFMNRFMLAEEFVDKGDTLTAFLVDHDDIFYDSFVDGTYHGLVDKNANANEQYVNDFNEAYIRTSNLLLNYQVSGMISNDEVLTREVIVYDDKVNELEQAAAEYTLENGE